MPTVGQVGPQEREILKAVNHLAQELEDVGEEAADDIDLAYRKENNGKMGFTVVSVGPLKAADFFGLDNCLKILEDLEKTTGDKSYAPCEVLKRYVQKGNIGIRSGKGFYCYN